MRGYPQLSFGISIVLLVLHYQYRNRENNSYYWAPAVPNTGSCIYDYHHIRWNTIPYHTEQRTAAVAEEWIQNGKTRHLQWRAVSNQNYWWWTQIKAEYFLMLSTESLWWPVTNVELRTKETTTTTTIKRNWKHIRNQTRRLIMFWNFLASVTLYLPVYIGHHIIWEWVPFEFFFDEKCLAFFSIEKRRGKWIFSFKASSWMDSASYTVNAKENFNVTRGQALSWIFLYLVNFW